MNTTSAGEHLYHLFTTDVPHHPMLWAALYERVPAKVIVDNAEHPSMALLRLNYGPTFLSRNADSHFALDALNEFRTQERVDLIVRSREEVCDLPDPDQCIDRIEFSDCDIKSVQAIISDTPRDCNVRPMDAKLFSRCLWYDEVTRACGNTSNFLERAYGLCLMHDDEILSEAYGCFRGKDVVEIGTVTHPEQRGRGLSPITCAHMIQYCHQRGEVTYWSCDKDNPASAKVAQKLGYRKSDSMQWLRYEKL